MSLNHVEFLLKLHELFLSNHIAMFMYMHDVDDVYLCVGWVWLWECG